MDPLSDVLGLLKPHSYASGGFDVGGDLSIQFPAQNGIRCYAVVHGDGWLAVDGVEPPVHLSPGDCFVLPKGRAFRLASDLSLPTVDAYSLFHDGLEGQITSWRGGGDRLLVGGHFTLAGDHASMLLGILPPIVLIRDQSDQAALRWCVERLMKELRDPQPGSRLATQHIAQLMLLQAIRLYLSDASEARVGWLFALADPQISGAIGAMHADPSRRWTLTELATRAGMSRSKFALRFKDLVGLPAIEYLTRWRMVLAGDRLTGTGESISVVAPSLGYESESAFSAAFKRVMGCSPRAYCQAGDGRDRGDPWGSQTIAAPSGLIAA